MLLASAILDILAIQVHSKTDNSTVMQRPQAAGAASTECENQACCFESVKGKGPEEVVRAPLARGMR